MSLHTLRIPSYIERLIIKFHYNAGSLEACDHPTDVDFQRNGCVSLEGMAARLSALSFILTSFESSEKLSRTRLLYTKTRFVFVRRTAIPSAPAMKLFTRLCVQRAWRVDLIETMGPPPPRNELRVACKWFVPVDPVLHKPLVIMPR